ncbi:NahK/ErcS family hybrid sensor histidine kinase/response regulator [Pannonibacter sp. Q-1]|uniref:PAS domain-containing hybrid sensor histidine kinase/response regulator n=1 Tax=Pannonibacter TaxID=227873 RepID=UPI00067E6224|nr:MULTISPECIES: PAS domain-containing hybrid sensor histidine kinase/response regulator [Pannonibacter]KND21002.1 histidine kinase [Pannonibacter phragmitetus]MBA4205439.1 TMAO reductase system sensor histidine kinase/response regulator TorS [Polymorphum sp.]
MLDGWIVTLSALGYILLLFAIASFGDRRSRLPLAVKSRPFIYALSLSVYCTSWTFYGSVGGATQNGLEFLAIYTGPILLFAFGFPLLRRIIRVAKTERITSIADFMAARYGKSQTVGATATVIAVIGIIPYIALQLKALSLSVTTMIGPFGPPDGVSLLTSFGDITLLIAIGMAVFAWLFGTRHIDATEHQEGLMLAIALEAVVKLFAFLAVGFWVTYALYDGPLDLVAAIATSPKVASVFSQPFQPAEWIAITCLSLIASLLLPRQFHVVVTENNSEAELRLATWMFPLYLIAINIFVVPIAAAGMLTLDPGINPDSYVLALPMASNQGFLALFAFIGGLSAATAMIIVATVALAIMISNDIVVPLILRQRGSDDIASTRGKDLSRMLLRVRRASIFVILLLAYAYYRAAGDTAALASIGLLSFAAIAQFAPAFFGGLFWRKATARGAIAGMVAGFGLWLYTLLLPTFVQSGLIAEAILFDGPFGIEWLRPQSLFYSPADPFLHGVAFSLLANLTCFILFSLTRAPEPSERLQANLFVPQELASTPSFRLWRTHVTVGDLKATVARYLGVERSERSFHRYARERGLTLDLNAPADAQVLRYSEQLLASAIGAASARLVLSLLLKRRDATIKGAMKLLDDASEAIQYNRDLLQTALDQVRQGIAVFDRDLRLICWNRQFRDLLGLPPEYGQVGTPLDTIIRFNAERGELRGSSADAIVADRIEKLVIRQETFQERLSITGTILEVRISPMPDGGIVTTFTDITERVLAEEALSRSHETLERRVRERTEELTRVNQQLVQATHAAEEANIGKTRFLAAAGHDILQPLNAARLYASVLVDRFREGEAGDLVRNVEASLESVEDIISAILDISRLDTGALKPEYGTFRLDEIFRALQLEFDPVARERDLRLSFVPTSLTVRSDRRLLRRLLQNLVSNALKYTLTGRVLVGCRRHGSRVVIEVHDTGIGIPASKQKAIFMEFHRLDDGIRTAKGLGLGLCIVERISRVLDHPVTLRSRMGKGSCFAVEVPSAAPVPVLPSVGEPVAVTSSQLDGMLVLAIDNEPNILDGMRRLLESWSCEVLTASNDMEAAQHVTQLGRTPDIMLVDYHLDQGNGIECAVRLRWKFGRSIPALLITADRSRAVRAEAAERDIGLLNKPVRPAALRAQLARVRAEMLVTE